jgi:hypothetical protein
MELKRDLRMTHRLAENIHIIVSIVYVTDSSILFLFFFPPFLGSFGFEKFRARHEESHSKQGQPRARS